MLRQSAVGRDELNVFPAEMEKFIWEAIVYAVFVLVGGLLIKPRWRGGRTAVLCCCTGTLVLGIQVLLLGAGVPETRVLTMLPVTAYLPAVILAHVVSAWSFLGTLSAWTIGAMAAATVSLGQKELIKAGAFTGRWGPFWVAACMAVAGACLLALVSRYMRRPFVSYMERADREKGQLVPCFPVLMVLMLFSYFANSAIDAQAVLLLLVTCLALFLILAKLMNSSWALWEARAEKRAVERQLEIQRRDQEDLRLKLEAGREYRHDLRHHLAVLAGLAKNENAEAVVGYIGKLEERLASTQGETWCENMAVNALLGAFMDRARELGCVAEVQAALPEELPYDQLDVCVLLANPIENALKACANVERGDRRLKILVRLDETGKMSVSIANTCRGKVDIGPDGLPSARRGDGHGLGLKSVQALVDKYTGVLECTALDGEFSFRAVIFPPSAEGDGEKEADRGRARVRPSRWGVRAGAVLLSMLTVFLFLNAFPDTADGLEKIPGLGSAVKAMDVRTYTDSLEWGDNGFWAEVPQVVPSEQEDARGEESALQEGVGQLQGDIDAYIEELRGQFDSYMAGRYKGYVGMDTRYEVLANGDRLLSVRFFTTLNAGSSGQYSRCFTLDKTTGEVLELEDLFLPDSGYIEAISSEITRQMEAEMEAGTGEYFLPGGIWEPWECFYEIEPDQDFYIDGQGRLTILFQEYQVAPGSMGMPEFTIPYEALEGMTAEDCPLSRQ